MYLLVGEIVIEGRDIEGAGNGAEKGRFGANFVGVDLFGANRIQAFDTRNVHIALTIAQRIFRIEQSVVGRFKVHTGQPGHLAAVFFGLSDLSRHGIRR